MEDADVVKRECFSLHDLVQGLDLVLHQHQGRVHVLLDVSRTEDILRCIVLELDFVAYNFIFIRRQAFMRLLNLLHGRLIATHEINALFLLVNFLHDFLEDDQTVRLLDEHLRQLLLL